MNVQVEFTSSKSMSTLKLHHPCLIVLYVYTHKENLLNHVFHSDEIITIEEDPGNVTKDEDKDDADEDQSEVDLTPDFVLCSLMGIPEINQIRLHVFFFVELQLQLCFQT